MVNTWDGVGTVIVQPSYLPIVLSHYFWPIPSTCIGHSQNIILQYNTFKITHPKKQSFESYGIVKETNFYSSGGSKLNETARSYKTLAQEVDTIEGVVFVWFTDGNGWNSARHNLEETFDVMEHIYNISDMENGIINEVFK